MMYVQTCTYKSMVNTSIAAPKHDGDRINNPRAFFTASGRGVRDAAIVAIALLRITKPKGAAGKGIGANRDDHPIFEALCQDFLDSTSRQMINRDRIFAARERVVRYAKQIMDSKYGDYVAAGDFEGILGEYERTSKAYKDDRELEQQLQEVKGYGVW